MKSLTLLAAVPKSGQSSPSVNNNTLYLDDYYSTDDLNDVVIIRPDNYAKIFGRTKSSSSTDNKLLSIVKVEYGNGKQRRSIHRRCYCLTANGFTNGMAALTYPSIRILAGDGASTIQGKVVRLSKGCYLSYFWYHPFHATRITMRLGLPSLILAIVSIVISIIIQCCC